MYVHNGKRVAFDAKIEVDGVFYSVNNQSDREAIGVIEIADPTRPSPAEHYIVVETDEAPFLSVTKKSDSEIELIEKSKAAADAKRHLADTDYLFTSDRHTELLAEEPERETDLRASRANARLAIREYQAMIIALKTET